MLQENHTFDNYFGMLIRIGEPTETGLSQQCVGVPQCWNIGDDGVTYNVEASTKS